MSAAAEGLSRDPGTGLRSMGWAAFTRRPAPVVDSVNRGEGDVVITHNGSPVAVLRPAIHGRPTTR